MNFFGMTDIGIKRESNQDVFYTHKFNDQVGFAIVCDGMGGQSAGHIASDMACEIISGKLIEGGVNELPTDQIRELAVSAISDANVQIYRKSNLEAGCKGMGTTTVLAIISGDTACVAHIGDSRVYLLVNGKLHQMTRDHSLVQELLEQGKISEEEVQNHPNKNMITRAVGVNLTVDIDYIEMPFTKGSKLLLCTDGLTNMVQNETIEEVLLNKSAKDACKKLISLANAAGGVDNITVAVIE